MSATFTLSLPPHELDPELCLFCGQVFRFVRTDSGFAGADGETHFRFECIEDGWQVTGGESAFHRLFRLDLPREDLARQLIACDGIMEPIIEATPGLRTMRPSNAEETFFCFLCTSNNHLSRIASMIQKLSAYGEGHLFPSADRIAAIGSDRLRELGFGYRADSIIAAAQRLATEPHLLRDLKAAPYEDAFRELLTFKGVGPKLADCICLFSLDHTEAVPVDTHMWQAFCRHYRPDQAHLTPTDARMREVGQFMRDRYGKLAGFAHHFMFVENLHRKASK